MPDISAVHHDIALTNVSLAYQNAAYISSIISPEIGVRKQSNKYFVYDPMRDSARQSVDHRAPGTEANEVNFDLSSESYYCDDHALESTIPDEERENADSPLQPETDRTEFLTDKILLNQEINVSNILRDDTVVPFHNIASPTSRWDDDAIDPVTDVETARAAIVDGTQQMPNTLILPFDVYQKVRNNPNVTDRIAYSRLGVFGPQELAQLFDVERVLVPRSVKNTATTGQPASLESIWGKDALMLYVPPRAGLKTIAPLMTFVWSQGAGTRGTSVQTWREEARKSTMVRVQKYYDVKLTAPSAAYLIKNAIS